MASEWAQERLRKWLDEVVDLNQRQIGFRIPELLDEVRKETAARCAEINRDLQGALLGAVADLGIYDVESAESAIVCLRTELDGYQKMMWRIQAICSADSAKPDDVFAAIERVCVENRKLKQLLAMTGRICIGG